MRGLPNRKPFLFHQAMTYKGFYINLDRCPDRRAEMEEEFGRFGLAERYERHRATEGATLQLAQSRINNGENGCFASHAEIIKENREQTRHLHIVEDDVVFASGTAATLDRLTREGGEIESVDILYTDIAPPLSNEAYREFKSVYDKHVIRDATGAIKGAAFQVLGFSPFMAASTSSYLVNGKSIGKLAQLLGDEMAEGPRIPLDRFYLEMARLGGIKVGFVFPFVTSVRIERTMTSTVRKVADTTMRFTAADLARYSFFIGCDMQECLKTAQRLLPVPGADDPHAQLLAHILAFSLTT